MQNKGDVQWEHSHDFGNDNQQNVSKIKVVFWITTVVMVLEIAAGTWTGSMALLADGWHMSTHSAAFIITLFAYAYAAKNSNNKAFSFGTGKVNYLGGFASAIALALVALMMAIESVQRLVEPHSIHFNEAIVVAIIGLAVNIVSVFVLHDDHHHHDDEEAHHHADGHVEHGHEHHDHEHSHHQHDHNMKAAYFHVLADTLTSLLAIVALLAGKYFAWVWMDPLMGIVGALVITKWSYGLIKQTSHVLLDKSAKNIPLSTITSAFKTEPNTIVTDVHVWKIGANDQAAIIALKAGTPREPAYYKHVLKHHLPQLTHVSIEVNKG